MKNYYSKFINGNISLPISFWLFGLIGAMIVGSSIVLILIFLNIFSNPLFRILCFPYLIITTIGIWQSANNYNGLKVWPIGAKIILVLWNLQNVLGIFAR